MLEELLNARTEEDLVNVASNLLSSDNEMKLLYDMLDSKIEFPYIFKLNIQEDRLEKALSVTSNDEDYNKEQNVFDRLILLKRNNQAVAHVVDDIISKFTYNITL